MKRLALHCKVSLLRDNFPWDSHVSGYLVSKGTAFLQGCLCSDQPCKTDVVSSIGSKERFTFHYNNDKVFIWTKGRACLLPIIKRFRFSKLTFGTNLCCPCGTLGKEN